MEAFVESLAYDAPIPGGGAAAAHCAACATALMLKVFKAWGGGVPKDETVVDQDLADKIEQLTFTLDDLANKDSQAYLRFSSARKTGDKAAIQSALAESVEPLLSMMALLREAAEILLNFGSACPLYLRADLQVSSELLLAALAGAKSIIQANLNLSTDKIFTREVQKNLEEADFRIGSALHEAKENISSRSRYSFPKRSV